MTETIEPKPSPEGIPFYRKPWFFFLSILLFWPLSLFLMLTGKTYYMKRGGQIVPMRKWSKALLAIVILFGGILFYANIAAKQSPFDRTTSSSASDGNAFTRETAPTQEAGASPANAAPTSNNDLAACDSDDTKDAVKQTLEQNEGIQVLDMGNFAEVACPALNMSDGSCLPPSDKDRYCNATVSLNTGTTSMKIHLFYGPSGKPLIQVEQGAWTDWSKLGGSSNTQTDPPNIQPNSTGDAECDKEREQVARSGQNQPLDACTNPNE